jgi:transposase
MLTIASLARAIEAVLPTLDTNALLPRKRKHVPSVPLGTLLAAVIWFSCSSMTTWKRFVHLMLPIHLSRYRLSYSRWSFWRGELTGLVEALAQRLCIKQAYRGIALVDSTCLPVCSIQRERDHKCLVKHASNGCGSLGWFLGFKLHLVTSDTGEILRFWLSTGKTHDTAPLLQPNFLRGLAGLLVGDSGYRVSKDRPVAKDPGLGLIARPAGVLNKDVPWVLRQLFQARWRIESTFSELKENLGLRASRSCRCLATFKTTVHSALIAYTLARRF